MRCRVGVGRDSVRGGHLAGELLAGTFDALHVLQAVFCAAPSLHVRGVAEGRVAQAPLARERRRARTVDGFVCVWINRSDEQEEIRNRSRLKEPAQPDTWTV